MSAIYSDEKNVQIIISLLKAHKIKYIVASPGATNTAFVASVQNDAYFKIFSCVDERSAAYIACGLSVEVDEPVVISCTGATASRNYLSGLTEAFYRKIPILAITSTQDVTKVGHHIAQVIDRSIIPKDVARLSVSLPIVKDAQDQWACELKVNQALLELRRKGGGPVHINLPTIYSKPFTTKELPACKVIGRIMSGDELPTLSGRIGIFVGSYKKWSESQVECIDKFCSVNNAVVFCDHTSAYNGKYRVQFALAAAQEMLDKADFRPDILIHIGEVSGDYSSLSLSSSSVWRVNVDGEVRDTFSRLSYVFEMKEIEFFNLYSAGKPGDDSYLNACKECLSRLREGMPDIPFSNIWAASQLASRIPERSTIHFAILNSLRAWNYFELPPSVQSHSNVGGFGIDGCLSSLVGASLADPDKLYFCVIGDLAFFYDMNVLGNRHIGNNLRILIVNNGTGNEFKQYNHHAAYFGESADEFIAASGHFGNKSPVLVRHYSQALGFDYLTASNKAEFLEVYEKFIEERCREKSIVFEIFTDERDESNALKSINNIASSSATKKIAKNIFNKMKARF